MRLNTNGLGKEPSKESLQIPQGLSQQHSFLEGWAETIGMRKAYTLLSEEVGWRMSF